jgi:hypothetical protein
MVNERIDIIRSAARMEAMEVLPVHRWSTLAKPYQKVIFMRYLKVHNHEIFPPFLQKPNFYGAKDL